MDTPNTSTRTDNHHDRYLETYPAHPGPRPHHDLRQPRDVGSGPLMPRMRIHSSPIETRGLESSGSGESGKGSGSRTIIEKVDDDDEDREREEALNRKEGREVKDWATKVDSRGS